MVFDALESVQCFRRPWDKEVGISVLVSWMVLSIYDYILLLSKKISYRVSLCILSSDSWSVTKSGAPTSSFVLSLSEGEGPQGDPLRLFIYLFVLYTLKIPETVFRFGSSQSSSRLLFFPHRDSPTVTLYPSFLHSSTRLSSDPFLIRSITSSVTFPGLRSHRLRLVDPPYVWPKSSCTLTYPIRNVPKPEETLSSVTSHNSSPHCIGRTPKFS